MVVSIDGDDMHAIVQDYFVIQISFSTPHIKSELKATCIKNL
jgi:hypothetical protein